MYDALMVKRIRSSALVGLLMWALMLPSPALSQSPVTVLYNEGLVHGFLVLRTLEGDVLAISAARREAAARRFLAAVQQRSHRRELGIDADVSSAF